MDTFQIEKIYMSENVPKSGKDLVTEEPCEAGVLLRKTLFAVKKRCTLVIHDNDAVRSDFVFRYLELRRDRAICK